MRKRGERSVRRERENARTAPETRDVTRLLSDWQNGDQGALDRLMPLLYNELRRIAARCLHSERSGHTLQTTALVHEAYLRLVDDSHVECHGRTHFLGIAATLIRRILVDHARTRDALKRGGGIAKLSLEEGIAAPVDKEPDVLAVDDALRDLSNIDPQQARIVELRFFAGLTIEETAEVLHVSPSTVKRDWILAKAWMYRALSASPVRS